MLVPNIFGGFDSRDLPNIRIGNGATMEQVMTAPGRRAANCSRIRNTERRKQRAPSITNGRGAAVFGAGAIGKCIPRNT
jgi:hypothetical protein